VKPTGNGAALPKAGWPECCDDPRANGTMGLHTGKYQMSISPRVRWRYGDERVELPSTGAIVNLAKGCFASLVILGDKDRVQRPCIRRLKFGVSRKLLRSCERRVGSSRASRVCSGQESTKWPQSDGSDARKRRLLVKREMTVRLPDDARRREDCADSTVDIRPVVYGHELSTSGRECSQRLAAQNPLARRYRPHGV